MGQLVDDLRILPAGEKVALALDAEMRSFYGKHRHQEYKDDFELAFEIECDLQDLILSKICKAFDMKYLGCLSILVKRYRAWQDADQGQAWIDMSKTPAHC